MSTDLRTELNDCDNLTGFTDSNKAPGLNTTVGQRYEGTGSIETQHTNTAGGNELDTVQTSGGGGTFSIDMSDRTLYLLLKDNLVDSFANVGIQFVLGDGTDLVGFQIAGYNAPGMPLNPFYNAFKLDASNLPSGSNTTYAGVEGNLTLTAITRVGVGTVHLAKAVGNVSNIFLDRISHIANDSYALRINGGTSGTPETMADVQGDDATSGWGLIANPFGKQYIFFGPTEFGEPSASADHYFQASNEQWFWVGDNGGGQAVGASHFPFRVVGNGTDAGSWKITNVVIVNTGTPAEFDLSNVDIDTLEVNSCTWINLGAIQSPSSGGTSRFLTNTIFIGCGQITHNGANMSGATISGYEGASDSASLVYDETGDPDSVLTDASFTKGTASTHAIEFGLNSPTTINLTGVTFSGYNASNEQTDSAIYVKRTSGIVNIYLDAGTPSTKSDGATVNVISGAVSPTVTVLDENTNPLEGVRVLVHASGIDSALSGGGPFPVNHSVTITQGSGETAVVSHTAHGMADGDKVLILGPNEKEYEGIHTLTKLTDNSYSYPVPGGAASITGTITATFVILFGLTNTSGVITMTRVFSSNQLLSGFAKQGTASPVYKPGPISGEVDSSAGFSATIQLIFDE